MAEDTFEQLWADIMGGVASFVAGKNQASAATSPQAQPGVELSDPAQLPQWAPSFASESGGERPRFVRQLSEIAAPFPSPFERAQEFGQMPIPQREVATQAMIRGRIGDTPDPEWVRLRDPAFYDNIVAAANGEGALTRNPGPASAPEQEQGWTPPPFRPVQEIDALAWLNGTPGVTQPASLRDFVRGDIPTDALRRVLFASRMASGTAPIEPTGAPPKRANAGLPAYRSSQR